MESTIQVRSSARPAPRFERDKPLYAVLISGVLLVAHHFYVVAAEEGFFFFLWCLPPLALLGLVGLIHPPIYYTITNKAKLVPTWCKIAAVVIGLAGVGLGIYVESILYDFPNPYETVTPPSK
jgi:hypothetical protein